MTAIAALWSAREPASIRHDCAAMIAAQRCCGPDATDLRESPGIAMARALLRVVPEDLHDVQPLAGGDGRFLLVADLRLDNRAELANALGIPPADLPAMSDAEVLLRAWERWQDDVFPHLAGDYAFAVHDDHRQRLTIARDPLGERPLFWSRSAQRVAVASTAVGLHALPDLPRVVDAERMARMFQSLSIGQRSYFADVQRVQPGHVVTFRRDGIDVRRHWHPRPKPLRMRRVDDYVEAYRERLDRATVPRLRRLGGPVAAHLSGGWDSGAVVATAARLLDCDERLIAYTAVPRTQVTSLSGYFADEGPLAAQVAGIYPNVEQVLVRGTGRSPLADLARHPSLYGRPVMALCNDVWVSDINARARDAGARVMLTGEMGNMTISAAPGSLLSDYLRSGRWWAWLHEASAAVRSGRARVRGALASSFEPWIPAPLWRGLERFSVASSEGAERMLRAEWIARFRDEAAADDAERRRRGFYGNSLASLMDNDRAEYRKGTVAAWGIEKRDPTADVRLVEFMMSLPLEMFLSNGVRRPLARAALADRLPAALLDERGKGYQAADWYEGLGADLTTARAIVDRIAADDAAASIIDVEKLRRLIDDWPAGGWEDRRVMSTYRTTLLSTLSIGHFLVSR